MKFRESEYKSGLQEPPGKIRPLSTTLRRSSKSCDMLLAMLGV